MSEFLLWNGTALRRAHIMAVYKYSREKYGTNEGTSYGVTVMFAGGNDLHYAWDSENERERYLSEITQKLAGTWLEDTPVKEEPKVPESHWKFE